MCNLDFRVYYRYAKIVRLLCTCMCTCVCICVCMCVCARVCVCVCVCVSELCITCGGYWFNQLFHFLSLFVVSTGSPSCGGRVAVHVFDKNQPSLPIPVYSVLVSISVFLTLSTVFHSINSPDNSQLPHSLLWSHFCLIGPFSYISL